MDILLVSANREKCPYPVFPLGLSYLAGPLLAKGHRLRILDLCFADDSETLIRQELASSLPEAVVISLRNIDNVTYPGSRSYLEGVKAVVDLCRGKAPVIIGGSGYSLMPNEILDFLGGDYGVVGEGEEILPLLLDRLMTGTSLRGLPGVVVRGEKDYIPPAPVAKIGRPERSLFQVERYNREGGMANLQTKRGCPFSCIYCTYPLLEGSRLRLRDIDDIVGEIQFLVERNGVEYLYFVDDIFNYPVDFAEALCRSIIDSGISIRWSAFINPAFITPDLIRIMVEAGCDAFEFGTDSGSPAMLRNLGKSFTTADVREASALCREHGVDFAHYILFGGPGETEETVLESFALMDEVAPTAVIGMTGIRIFPGTPLHRKALEEGVITPDTSLLEPVFYLSPAVRDSLCDLVTKEAMKRRNWVVPGLEINMSDAMMAAIRHFPVKGPLWKLMKRLGRSRIKPMTGT
ncbi:MAG TPA: lipid biosynthesis B12-binding/radical SAM protein [Geobacteraceae bacterium]|nr:lipid biosynthesis B12-binding/radical SAM protein [Geobacteraceae bacterium]